MAVRANTSGEQGYPGGLPAAIFVDTNDTVWVKAPSGELVSQSRGESKFRLRQYVSEPSSNPAFLGEDPESGIWISDDNGIRLVDLRASTIEFPPTSGDARHCSAVAFANSRLRAEDIDISNLPGTTKSSADTAGKPFY